MTTSKKPPTAANIFAAALASRSAAAAAVAPGVHNTLECARCGAARERDAEGPLVCRYCGGPLGETRKVKP